MQSNIYLIQKARQRRSISRVIFRLIPVILLLVVLGLMIMGPAQVSAQGGPELKLTKTTFQAEVETGEPFEYVFNYRCASINDNCEGAIITDALPPEVEFIPGTIASTPHVDHYAYDAGTHTITWTFVDPLPAGSTGILKLQVRFPAGTVPGTTATNTATFSATNATPVTTAPVTTTATGQFEMYAEKTGGPAIIGFPTIFDLNICSPDNQGGVRFTSPTIVDSLPPDATFVGAQGSQCTGNVPPGAGDPECWVYDAAVSPRTVTWYNLPDVEVGGCFTRQITLQYDSDPGTTQTNVMDATGTPEGCENPANLPAYCNGTTQQTLSDNLIIGVEQPYPQGTSSKSSTSVSSYQGTEALPGETITYTVSVANSGYEDLTNVVVTDTIPTELILQSFTIGPASAPGDAVNGFYQVDGSTWFPLPGNSYTTTTTIDATALDLHGGARITELKWELGTLAIGANWSSTVVAQVDPTITPTDPPATFDNCTGFTADQATTDKSCSTVSIIHERAIPRPAKTSNGEKVLPEEYVDFTVGVHNEPQAHLALDNPMLVDLLPPEFDYVAGSATITSKPAGAPDPNFEVIPDYNSTGRTLLRWTWQDRSGGGCDPASIEGTCGVDARYSFQPGENAEISFTVQVKKGTPPGTVANEATIVDWTGPTDPDDLPNSDPRKILLCDPPNQYVDTNDLDGDGSTTEVSCLITQPTEVGVFLSMDSEKWVRGEIDCGTYNDPNVCNDPTTTDVGDFNKLGLTMPGERVDYLIHTVNDSNVPVTDIEFVDILPYIDDRGVIDLSPRLSQWRPNLQAEVVNLDSTVVTYTVFYSASANPCRPELASGGPAGCEDPLWSTTLPSDPTSVQSIKVDFCTYNPDGSVKDCLILNPDATLSFGWHMAAPNSAPGDASCLSPADDSFDPATHPDCKIAWNSFGFKAVEFRDNNGDGVNDLDHLELLPSEPKKVGIRVAPSQPNSLGDYVWLDVAGLQNDGIQQTIEQQSPWGVNGVRVELWDAGTASFIDYRITGPDHAGRPGYYLFSDLPDGNYYLRFFPPAGYTASPANQGTDDALDSDGEIAGTDATYGDYLQTADITLAGGVEDLTWDFGMYWPTDYGDAPFDNATDFYPTNAHDLATAALDPANAARHVIRNDLRMGATVDAELDGLPSLDAWGDDLSQTPDDEDGVTFDNYLGTPALPSAIMVIGETSAWKVSLNVPDLPETPDPDTAYLNAWLDFNGDGDWDDAGEQIAVDVAHAPGTGTVTLNIPVPAGATPGTTHARFRLSYTQGLQPTGAVNYGEVEDYHVQLVSKPVKSIAATSEAHTADPDLTIGEIVRYTLTVSVPEGSMPNFVITDTLPAGLQYLDDGTAALSFTSDNTMTSTGFTVSGGPFGDGTDPVFTLGTVTNPDQDNNEEFVVIEFNALVLNVVGNAAGDTRANAFQVTYDTFDYTSAPATINLVEPAVSIVKTVTTLPPIDAGDQVTYQLQLTNNTSANEATAFDLAVDDILDANLDLTASNLVTVTAPSYATVTNNSDATADEVHVLIDKLQPGDQVTILVTVTVLNSVSAGEIIPNVANLSYTSLPGPNGTTTNATGSATPGATDTQTGERLYGPSDSQDITIASPQVDKLVPNPTEYTIGEDITYTIKVTLPEGTTKALVVVDDLPAGLGYQSYQIITTAAASGGKLGADFNGVLAAPTVTAPGGSGVDATFDFGDTVTNADNNAGNNSFLIELVARVLNTSENHNGDTKDNIARLRYTNPNNQQTEEITDIVTVTIIEPFLNIAKEVVSQPDPVGPNGQVKYRVTISHTTASAMNAYDVVMTDTLPSSLTNVQVTSTSPTLTWSYDSSTGILRLPATGSFDIPLGGVYVIEYTADITTAADPGGSIDNNAQIDWTSMDGDFAGRERKYTDSDTASIHVDGEFGDLPDSPYPTLYASNGARHLVPVGGNPYFLGATVDVEPDGQPNASATGDDANPPGGPNDEDGVLFLTPIMPNLPANIQITANSNGFIHGWMDFDVNGVLDDIIITAVDGTPLSTPTAMRDYPILAGPHTYTFNAPANTTTLGPLYARFRFTSYETASDPPNDPIGLLGPDGLALDGEVEDYVLISIGNYVWFDDNGNGVQDAGEPATQNVVVNLLDATGAAVTDASGAPISATTDANGWYNFGGLPTGDYIVEVDASNWNAGNVFGAGGLYPDAYGSPGQGGDDHVNTDDNGDNDGAAAIGVGVRSVPINLSPGLEPTNEDPQEITPNANSDLTIDFGFTLPVSVGSLVWRDVNANGIQDSGEPTVENATVTLLDSSGNPITTDLNGSAITPVTTGADGIYHFTELPAGDYIIQVQPPAGMKPTPPQISNPNTDDNTDSNIANESSSGVYRSGVVTLSIGGEPTGEAFADSTADQDGKRDDSGNMTVDFGFVQPVSLGSFVWVDLNRDGVQDVGEPPIPGAVVTLLDDTGAPVTTDLDGNAINPVTTGADGVYTFSNLPPGDYRVDVQPPAGHHPSPVQDTTPNDDNNSDSNIASDQGGGVWRSAAISLLGGTEPIGETFADGLADQDGNPDVDGNMTLDFGFFTPVSVGSFVWLDQNADGLQGASEPGISGAVVTLLDSSGVTVTVDLDNNPITPVTTGTDGVYHFMNLPPGGYRVQVEPPAGFIPTPPQVADPNTDNNTDSNIATEPSAGVYRSGVVTLTLGLEPTGEVFADGSPDQDGNPDADGNMTVDFGFIEPVSLGSFIWRDSNGDGVQDDGEPGIQGVTVTLLDSSGNPVNDVNGALVTDITTGTDGVYHFTNLVPGGYRVQVTPPAGYLPTLPQVANPNGDDNADSNIASEPSPGVYQSDVITLAVGFEPTGEVFADSNPDQDGNPDADGNMTVDFGFVTPVSLGSLVWFDENVNGVQDANESPISGAVVTLLNSAGNPANDIDGNPAPPVTTGVDGVYHFTNLRPGDYSVEVTPPPSFTPTGPQQANPNTNDNTDSNIASEPSFGVYRSGLIALSIGGEPTGETFAGGSADQDGNPDASGNMTVDFGFVVAVSVGSLVWQDNNSNGIQEVGEPPIQGAVVTLLDNAGNPITQDITGNPITSVTTGLDGVYHFTNLPAGDYIIQVEPSVSYIASPVQQSNPNTDDNTDSNIASEPTSGVYQSGVVTLSVGGEPTNEIFVDGSADQDGSPDASGNMTVDFGFTPIADLGSLGDFVWWDINGDGLQDAGEPGISGVTLTLTDNMTLNTTTDANGIYTFTNLVSDVYTITIDASNFQPGGPLENWTPSPAKVGNDDTIDSDGDETTHDYSVTLAAGEDNPNIDFGFYVTSSYTLTKKLNTTSDIRPGDPISFTIAITNTGGSWLAVLPLTDNYNATYLSYGGDGHFAEPPSDDNNDDGQIDWADITGALGDIAPGGTAAVTVWFTALADTSGETNGATTNTATAHGVMADPDGPNGPLPSDEPLDDVQGPTSDSDAVVILQPTGLFVTDFSAVAEDDRASLSWETVSELNIAGFQVLRRRGLNAEAEIVADAFVPARWSGMDQGGIYALADADLAPGVYRYILQAVLLEGSTVNIGTDRVVIRSWRESHR